MFSVIEDDQQDSLASTARLKITTHSDAEGVEKINELGLLAFSER